MIKWNYYKKIKVFEKDIINSINFFVPSCIVVFRNVKSFKKKELNTSDIKYKRFNGKILRLSLEEKFADSIEEKYGVFVVDGFIFRKEDFGMKSYRDEIEEKKKGKEKNF